MDIRALTRSWRRSLIGGVIWFIILFLIDLIDSFYLLERSTKRVQHDEQTTQIIVEEVGTFLAQICTGYLFLGLLAGIVIHFFMLCWFPKEPNRKQWIKAWLGFSLQRALG